MLERRLYRVLFGDSLRTREGLGDRVTPDDASDRGHEVVAGRMREVRTVLPDESSVDRARIAHESAESVEHPQEQISIRRWNLWSLGCSSGEDTSRGRSAPHF
jgi:chemotaxis methyl-accepting protein methylase